MIANTKSTEQRYKPAKKKYESERQLARQASILAATREMLAEMGYTATTMRGLADRAHVAPGTLYNLYKSKDELVLAAVEDLLEGIGRRAIANSKRGVDRILALAEQTSAAIKDTPKYAEAMARALYRVEVDDRLTTLLYARSLPFIKRQILMAQRAGELLETADADKLSRHFQAQSWGIIMAWVMGIMPLEQVREEYLRSHLMILLSVAKGKAKKELQAHIDSL